MDSIITSALEEICSHGQGGISLSSLCSRLSVSPPLKPSLWKNLLPIPALRFKARTAEFLSPSDDSIQCVEDAEKLEIKILADEKLRNNFVGLYDENVQISSQQRRTLERLAIARTNGVTQSQLAKEFGIEGKNFFYILKNLECRGLIVKQPAVVRKKEPCIEGESKNSSPVTTNLIYLYRYAKRLGSQQRFEINKEEETVESLGYEDENVPDKDGVASENVKENVLVNDYLPAMKAVCDKLEEANGKVLVVSDIKRDLGYTRSSGHKAWRNIHRRLKDAGLVEDFHAVVNEKVELCLRSVKRFSEKNFDLKILGFDDQLNKGQQLKFGRTLPNVDQIVELPIDTQIYDIVDAEGSEGLPVMTVCEKLGIDKKRSYPRFFNMFSKFGMHHQAESHKKTTAYRVWTSGNSNPKSCNAFLIKSKNANDENETCNPNVGSSEVPNGSNQNFLEYDLSTSAGNSTPLKIDIVENDPEVSCGSHGETNRIVVYSDNMQEFPTEQSNNPLDSELRLVSTESEIRAPPPEPTQLALLKPSDSASCQTYSCQVQTADAARREQRILERLQDEKFILRPELYRWLVELEKDKSTKLDRKTVDRLLKKLQQQGHCKCMNINVPVVTNCGRSRITQVVLHPSVESLHPELLGGIHDRLRSFEMQIRSHGSSKLKKDDSVPVLDGVQRTQNHTVSDAKAAKSEAMRANGFVLAKMVRSKLLHGFLWGFLSSSNGWDDAFSLEKHLNDQRNLHGSCILFSLEAAIKAIPLELFSQIVGSTLKFDDMIEKCKKGFCLSDLPIQEYKLLMDTQATGRLSLLIDILRRLKLIRLVPDESSDNRVKVAHANLTHAMELKPYIEEPLSVISTSTFRSLDLRPRIRHDFILSNREAVDDYWKTLEYCYAAADPRAALHAFPGSAVHEVFLNRSWASVRVMTAEQRAELLKRIVKDNLNEKLSYKHCRKIANDLDLTLEQVLRVYYDKHQKRLNRFRGVPNSIEEHQVERNKQSSARKRKRSSKVKSAESTRVDARTIELDEQEIATPPVGSDGYTMEQHGALTSSVGPAVSQTHQEADNVEAVSKAGTLEEDEECYSLITQYAFPKLKPTRTKRFSWTDGADRELVMRYARYRAALGAKFHRVDWTSIDGLPAPPRACARRITFLKRNAKFRKALMKLCNMLSERYVMHLERNQNRSLNNSDCRLLVRSSSVGFSNGIEHGEDEGFEEERWDDFDDRKIKRALEDALRFKQIVKLEASKRAGSISAEWSNINMNSEDNLQGPEIDSPSTQGEDMGRPGAGRKGSSQSSRNHRFHQKLVKLWNVGNGAGRQVHDSLAVSNAVELFKLVFLSTSTAPPFPNLLAETLRRYSEHDLFAGFSYLRDRKIMIGGTCGQPFVLSQQFLHSISKSPFPRNTGKRAANFSAWLHERKNDLMEGGMNLTEDLQCGDIFHLFSLVSSGELSVFPCLPDEGIGEAEDLRSLKRRAEDNELCDADKAKKLKSIAEGEFVSRREKGFPGIMVSVYSTMVSASNALELFKDGTCTLDHVNDESLSQKVNRCSTNSDYMKEMLEFGNNVTIASKSKVSPWDAMASYSEHLLSNPSYEEGSHFDPEIIKAVHAEIQKAGDQGLGIEDVYNHIKVPGGMTPEIIIDTLQAFGRAFKVNAYDSVRVVDALYHSKYFLASSSCFHRDLRPSSSLASQGKDGGNFILQQESVGLDTANLSGSVTAGDVHKVTILNLPEEHALPSNKVPSSNVNESCMGGEVSLDGDNEGAINKPSSCEPLVPILPWVNADGTINQMVYNGLIRRVLGTVMQNPGMLEEDIICQMDVLNPQNCRKLLELMILDRHLIVKKMVQATGSGPPALLATLLGSSYRKPKFVSLNHYFANPTSTFML